MKLPISGKCKAIYKQFLSVAAQNTTHWHIISRNLKGVIFLPATGYITVRAFTSKALLPLPGVAVVVTAIDGTAIAMRTTDRSGLITPIEVPVPELSAGQTPNTGQIPFTSVNLYARLPRFEQIEIENLQVFPGTTTIQNLEMIPLSEFPNQFDQSEIFPTPPQNL